MFTNWSPDTVVKCCALSTWRGKSKGDPHCGRAQLLAESPGREEFKSISGCLRAYSSLPQSFQLMFGVMKLAVCKTDSGGQGWRHTYTTLGRAAGRPRTCICQLFFYLLNEVLWDLLPCDSWSKVCWWGGAGNKSVSHPASALFSLLEWREEPQCGAEPGRTRVRSKWRFTLCSFSFSLGSTEAQLSIPTCARRQPTPDVQFHRCCHLHHHIFSGCSTQAHRYYLLYNSKQHRSHTSLADLELNQINLGTCV